MDRSILIIRHGEKPPDGKNGIDAYPDGKPNPHSLIPIGWERANALPSLFKDPLAWFPAPMQLIAPNYGKTKRNEEERTYQTIAQLGAVETPFKKGDETKLGRTVAAATSGVTLICWEHNAIHEIANAIPTPAGPPIPQSWPDDRFDVVWVFEKIGKETYAFSQVPQMLMPGDKESTI